MGEQPKKFHLVLQFLGLYILFAVTLAGIFGFAFISQFSKSAFQGLRDEAMQTAVAVSESINFSGHETILRAEDANGETYQRIVQDLIAATDANPDVSYIYTMRPLANGEWVFVVDGSLAEDLNDNGVFDEDEVPAEINEVYDIECCPNLPLGLEGATADEMFSSDVWGTWISGYAPLTMADGTVIGIVGVDISIDTWIASRNQLYSLVTLTLSITLAFIFVFGLLGAGIFGVESRRVNDALKIRNEELSSLVKKRTQQLQEFMAAIVHELRAPLTVVKWQIEELQTKKRSKAENEQLSDVHEVSVNLLGLIGDFLDASKISVGKFSIKKTKGDLAPTLVSAVTNFQSQARGKHLDLMLTMSKALPRFPFDSARVTQVMNNLLSNAIKYTETGSITVRAFEEDSHIKVEVVDTGIGMNVQSSQKLFEPFVRVGDTEKQVGAGLGLAIVKGIIDGHGGAVGVSSKKGAGSTFWFTLPL